MPLPRPRSGTWGSKSDTKYKDGVTGKLKAKHESKGDGKKDRKKDKGGSRSGSNSRSSSAERRRSGEDLQSPKKGVGGVLDTFRSRSNSDADKKKKPNALVATMRNMALVCDLKLG